VYDKPMVYYPLRGFFFESWHAQKFAAAGSEARFVLTCRHGPEVTTART
jgi:hypothetical protein